MSALTIVVIAVIGLLLLLFLGGLAGSRRRLKINRPQYEHGLAQAEHALARAHAADRGWDRELLEDAARQALAASRPDHSFDELRLVLVEDRPGVDEDRARMLASGSDGEARLTLARREGKWVLDRIE